MEDRPAWPPRVPAVAVPRVPNDIEALLEDWTDLEELLEALLDSPLIGCRQAE